MRPMLKTEVATLALPSAGSSAAVTATRLPHPWSNKDISLKSILTGSLRFLACMAFAIILLCQFPGLGTWLPDLVMGVAV